MSEMKSGIDYVRDSNASQLVSSRSIIFAPAGFFSRHSIGRQYLERSQINTVDTLKAIGVTCMIPGVIGLTIFSIAYANAVNSQEKLDAPRVGKLKNAVRASFMDGDRRCISPDSRFYVPRDGENTGYTYKAEMKADASESEVIINSAILDDPELRVRVLEDGTITASNEFTRTALTGAGCEIK